MKIIDAVIFDNAFAYASSKVTENGISIFTNEVGKDDECREEVRAFAKRSLVHFIAIYIELYKKPLELTINGIGTVDASILLEDDCLLNTFLLKGGLAIGIDFKIKVYMVGMIRRLFFNEKKSFDVPYTEFLPVEDLKWQEV